jgi:hypothetical protein
LRRSPLSERDQQVLARHLNLFLNNSIDDSLFPSSSQDNPRVSVSLSSLPSKPHAPSWTHSFPSFKSPLQLRMAHPPPLHSTRLSKPVHSTAGAVSKSITLKAQTPIPAAAQVASQTQTMVHVTLATPQPPFFFSVDWTLCLVPKQSSRR